jgi:hypothetical protein
MKTLELKHLPYFPYKLKVLFDDNTIGTVGAIFEDGSIICRGTANTTPENFKPILRPLSDLYLTIKINNKEFCPEQELKQEFCNCDGFLNWLKYYQKIKIKDSKIEWCVVNKMIEWHFDVFGLIENGLAVDLNTLK